MDVKQVAINTQKETDWNWKNSADEARKKKTERKWKVNSDKTGERKRDLGLEQKNMR